MITPPQTSAVADRVANQSWQLLKPHLDLHLSHLNSVQPHSLAAEVTLKNQSVSHLLTQILPDVLTSINEKPQELISSVKANQVVLSYRHATTQNAFSLKSIYMIENISRYIPLISKLHSLQLPVFRSSEDMFFFTAQCRYCIISISQRAYFFWVFQILWIISNKAAPTTKKIIPKEAEEVKTQRKLKQLIQLKLKLF